MKILFLIAVFGWSCFAYVVETQQQHQQQQLLPVEKQNGISYALDLSLSVSLETFLCIRQHGYSVVLLRAYSPAGQGQPDPSVVANIKNANEAGLGIEVYMTPQPNSKMTGDQQFAEMMSHLTSSGIKVRTVWIQVTSSSNWHSNFVANIQLILSITTKARQYRLSVGIYTSYTDWNKITYSSWLFADAMLWYWKVSGAGIAGESPSNFKDFVPFEGWNSPVVKQFAQAESVCGVTVNRDIYATSSLLSPVGAAEFAKTKQIVVGNFGL